MNPALRSSAAHVFVQTLQSPELGTDDSHHLFRVLRLRNGEQVTVSDGFGGWRVTEVSGHSLQPVSAVVVESDAAPLALAIASAIPKGDRVDWMVQKLTEIGIGEITLLHCERSVVCWDDAKADHQLVRLRRVAREAAMQSRRLWLPQILGPLSFQSVAARPGAVIADPDGAPFRRSDGVPSVVIVGPEGGFSAAELSGGAVSVRFGDSILRVETAAVVAAVCYLL